MAAILDFAMPISETAFPVTGNIIGTKIVKITPIKVIYGNQCRFIYVGSHIWFWWPDCNTNFRNGFAAIDNPYKVVLGDSLVHLDIKSEIF